jgi:diadenosine tetraphosphate (Ap4A) HIT family hydrolase
MNETIQKFGYPQTLIAEYANWVVLLRTAQPTLGSLILAAKSDAIAFGGLIADAYAELSVVTKAIETALSSEIQYERINYLMLMMVDPHVHFHVIPRYEGARRRAGLIFPDAGWPKTPDLTQIVSLDAAQIDQYVHWLRQIWPSDR